MVVAINMGVSGVGKTTIGCALATDLSLPFYDADDFHPPANIETMRAGKALTDTDRLPWLQDLSSHSRQWRNSGGVLACSALKESYRSLLSADTDQARWICLSGRQEIIRARIKSRQRHFMDENLLNSQLNTLEVPEYGFIVDISHKPDRIVESVKKWISDG